MDTKPTTAPFDTKPSVMQTVEMSHELVKGKVKRSYEKARDAELKRIAEALEAGKTVIRNRVNRFPGEVDRLPHADLRAQRKAERQRKKEQRRKARR